MSQGVSVLVVFPCETLDVVVARLNRALFRALSLVRQHMRLQVLERLATIRVGTSLLLLRLITVVRILVRSLRLVGRQALPPSWCWRRRCERTILLVGMHIR